MNTNYPVTLFLRSAKAAEELARNIAANGPFMVGKAGENDPAGLVIYELGQDVDRDFERITRLLAGGRVAEVFVTATTKDPDAIIRAMRAGVSEFLPWPFEAQDLSDALGRFLERNSAQNQPASSSVPTGPQGRVVYLLGAKGGVGTTTVAVNAATEAARRSTAGPTALVDARMPMGEVPLFLDFEYTYTWAEAVRDESRLDRTFLESLMTRHECGLDILAAPDSLAEADAISPSAVKAMINLMRTMYARVFVDGGPYLDDTAMSLMEQADDILLVTELNLPCLTNVQKLMDTFANLDGDLNDKLHLVLNRHLSKSDITEAEAEDLLGRPMSWKIPNDYESATSAINQGLPMADVAPRSAATRALRGLAADLAPNSAVKHKGKGLFGRFLSREPKQDNALPSGSALQGAQG